MNPSCFMAMERIKITKANMKIVQQMESILKWGVSGYCHTRFATGIPRDLGDSCSSIERKTQFLTILDRRDTEIQLILSNLKILKIFQK